MDNKLFSLCIVTLNGWLNRHQREIIIYQQTEIAVLREQLGEKRIVFTDAQRIRLARAGKRLSPGDRRRHVSLVTPETILRWHRRLIAQKWTFPPKNSIASKRGRPELNCETEKAILRLAKENPGWGYRRISGEMKQLGMSVSHQTVANILAANGIAPAPERKKQTTWKQFFRRHKELLWSTDFLTAEVWTSAGLTTFYVLFFFHIQSRKVVLGGITENPDELWMTNRIRELTWDGGPLKTPGILIHDRDAKYSNAWQGTQPVCLCNVIGNWLGRAIGMENDKIAAEITEPECPCGKVCENHKRGMSRPTHTHRGKIVAKSSSGVSGTLSRRVASSGHWEYCSVSGR